MIMYRPATNSLAIEREVLNFLRSRGYQTELSKAQVKADVINAQLEAEHGEGNRAVYEVTVTVREIER